MLGSLPPQRLRQKKKPIKPYPPLPRELRARRKVQPAREAAVRREQPPQGGGDLQGPRPCDAKRRRTRRAPDEQRPKHEGRDRVGGAYWLVSTPEKRCLLPSLVGTALDQHAVINAILSCSSPINTYECAHIPLKDGVRGVIVLRRFSRGNSQHNQ